MLRLHIIHAAALLSLTLLAPGCTSSSDSRSRELVTVARQVGSWEGTGNKTIGFVSETGCFRVNWKTRKPDPASRGPQPGSRVAMVDGGMFRLTVRSAISGRPIQVIADHQGPGSGTVDFRDDPRIYDFLVDSSDIQWAFTVEELFDIDAGKASPP